MPTLSSPQKSNITTLQTKLADAKSALIAVANAADAVRLDMVAVGTVESLKAGNAAGRVQGVAIEARGMIVHTHFLNSDALLDYDAAQGPGIVMNGPGGR